MNPQKPFIPESVKPGSVESGSIENDALLASINETLRLIAHLPAPEGLEERIQAGVRASLLSGSQSAPQVGRLLAWPVKLKTQLNWAHSAGMRAAAAAAIVCVVLGGGWGILSRVQTAQPQTAVAQPQRPSVSAGFSSAGAMRTPLTLNGPVVTQSPSGKTTTKAAGIAVQTPHHRAGSPRQSIRP